MITNKEPGILERKVQWALGNITTNKASGGDEIPLELFQILKDNAVKVLYWLLTKMFLDQSIQSFKSPVFTFLFIYSIFFIFIEVCCCCC